MAMHKLQLDQLDVESFTLGEGWDARGTVRAASATIDQDTCYTCQSDQDTCVSCVNTCYGPSCDPSCASCPVSCDPAQCPSADGRC